MTLGVLRPVIEVRKATSQVHNIRPEKYSREILTQHCGRFSGLYPRLIPGNGVINMLPFSLTHPTYLEVQEQVELVACPRISGV